MAIHGRPFFVLPTPSGLTSIAIPAIGSGIFGFPRRLCAQVILRAVYDYCWSHKVPTGRVGGDPWPRNLDPQSPHTRSSPRPSVLCRGLDRGSGCLAVDLSGGLVVPPGPVGRTRHTDHLPRREGHWSPVRRQGSLRKISLTNHDADTVETFLAVLKEGYESWGVPGRRICVRGTAIKSCRAESQ